MIGQRLKELRLKKGVTIKNVAAEIDVSPSTYREWELGTKISGEPYVELAKYFNVSLSYLLCGEQTPSKAELISDLNALKQQISILESKIITNL